MKTKLISVGQLQSDPNWEMKVHSHSFHQMIVLLRGKMHVRIARKDFYAQTGDVLLYPAGFSHKECSDRNDPVESIYFGWKGDVRKLPLLAHDLNGRIRLLARWLYEEREHLSPYSSSLQETILQVIIREFLRTSSKKHDLIRTVRNFMRDHLEKTMTLEGLAQQVGISKYHFLRKYKNLTGRTPMEDLRRVRVEAAKELILTTNLPLKAIAPKVGFANEYHLSRMFRKYLNLTPRYFRKNEGSYQ